ncbi:MAG: hypothetical protein J5661_06140 [Bacteroidaceae bacterium]|nr:hypothetical protein [Bacteroidaceae bacterium]
MKVWIVRQDRLWYRQEDGGSSLPTRFWAMAEQGTQVPGLSRGGFAGFLSKICLWSTSSSTSAGSRVEARLSSLVVLSANLRPVTFTHAGPMCLFLKIVTS